jgi:predicted nucleotidyltransferase
MGSIGIVAEYNPFHNGHLYHLNKIKEMYPDETIIVVLSGHFMQRGETSIINKWDKTNIALFYGADIVIELPFPFATQSADIFAKGSIEILKAMKVDKLIFGSESNDIDKLTKLASIQLNNKEYSNLVKKYLDEGVNYPTALSKSLTTISNDTVSTPNDILGISYIREIIKQNANIEAISIKRTNDYHGVDANDNIASASNIRTLLKKNDDIAKLIPSETQKCINHNLSFIEEYFPFLKYQVLTNLNNLHEYQTVDEGIENRIKKNIITSTTLEELILKIKTKRYTYNKIRRMFTHIMCNFTKEEASHFQNICYLRILGFSNKGQKYLNHVKKEVALPIITNFNKYNDDMLDLEMRATCVYASILNEKDKIELIEKEYKNFPIKYNKNG